MANTDEDSWDENAPVLTDPRRDGALEILSLRQAVGKRVAKEHVDPDAAGVGGEHLEGSARGFVVATTAPTTKPDGVTALDAQDEGRFYVDTDDDKLFYWTGSAWVIASPQQPTFVQSPIRHDGTLVDVKAAFNSSGGYENTGTFAEFFNWNYFYKTTNQTQEVEYKKAGGAFVTFQTQNTGIDKPDDATGGTIGFLLQGSFILNPGDFMRLTQTLGTKTYFSEQATRVRFLV